MKNKNTVRLTLTMIVLSFTLLSTMIPMSIASADVGDWIEYEVAYDSGEGTANISTWTYTVTETGVEKESVSNCFALEATITEQPAERRNYAPIVGIASKPVTGEWQWRTEAEGQLISMRQQIDIGIPI